MPGPVGEQSLAGSQTSRSDRKVSVSRRTAVSHNLDRRGFLHLGGLGLAGLALVGEEAAGAGPEAATGALAGETSASAKTCASTAANIEGPFYRASAPLRSDLDLYGDRGTPVTITGRVVDQGCQPVAGAVVEAWQAAPDGRYDNRSRQMRYRCQIQADADGSWQLKTLMPGFYLNGARFRPAHIHIKVWVDGVEKLTTQLYFEGDPYLAGDRYAGAAPVLHLVKVDDETSTAQVALVV